MKIDPTQKVKATSFKTIEDVQKHLMEAGASNDEANALIEKFTGTSVMAACKANNLVVEGEAPANTVARARNRFCTILLNLFDKMCEPAAKKVDAEAKIQAEADSKAELAASIIEWEKNGQRGRKPGEGNRPKWQIALDKAFAEAKRCARQNLNIAEQGRITPDKQDAFVAEFKVIYTHDLTELAAKFPENISGDEAKITKMVNHGVKELAVTPTAQKAVKVPKAKKTDAVPATEAVVESELVVSE